MKKPVFGLLFLLIILAALLVRVVRLDLRPMHHDEANQAVKFGSLLEQGEYRYDRMDHHGPSLYFLSLPFVRIITGPKFADTNESVLRLVPVLFGLGIIILLLLLKDALSISGVILTAILAAVSPLMVFYSRFYIQEILLVFFTMGSIAAGWRYYRNPNTGWAVLTGFFLSMMYATKETCLIIVAAFIGALILTRVTTRRPPKANTSLNGGLLEYRKHLNFRHLLCAFGAALLIGILFYSSFFKNPAGPVDSVLAFKTYLSRAGEAGFHQHPWYYYIKMLAFSKYGSGPFWSEGLVLLLALVGCAAAIRGKVSGRISPLFLRFIFFYTLLTTLIFSLIPYKTPWNMLPFYLGMLMLAGAGGTVIINFFKTRPAAANKRAGCSRHPLRFTQKCSHFWERLTLRRTFLLRVRKPLRGRPTRLPDQRERSCNFHKFFQNVNKKWICQLGVYFLLFAGIANLGMQSFRANFKYYADNRNPYVYAHTVNDFKRLVARIQDIAALHPAHQDMLIKVITNPYDTWPLPWYLRKFRMVGYWQDVESAAPLDDVPVIVASLDRNEKIQSALKSGYQHEYYGLRPEILLVVYIRQDLWQEFIKTRAQ